MDTASVSAKPYRPRVIDSSLQDLLAISGAVVIEGPRSSGKTMTALHAARSAVFLDDETTLRLIELNPAYALDGPAPRLIDEWQVHPAVWNSVRRAVDAASEPGRFILTGSAVPSDDATRHTGAGRFLRLRQRTMSWYERGLAPQATVSLAELFNGQTPSDGPVGGDYTSLVTRLCTSGFPQYTDLVPRQAQIVADGYLTEVIHSDLSRLEEVRLSPLEIRHLLQSLARLVSAQGSYETIAQDMRAVSPGLHPQTIARYCSLLERIFVLEPQEAWTPRLRSRARLRTSPTWHLADVSLTAAALGAGPDQLAEDPETTGLLFESQVVHDLRCLAAPLRGTVYHYRDSSGREIDAVVVLPDGRWGAVEVKISATQVTAGVESLRKAVEVIEGEPSFRLVVTAMGPTLTAQDGTVTCPLEALAP